MMRIWVTRDEPSDGPLAQALENTGLVPIHCPVVHRRKLGDAAEELAQLGRDDWIVLTSAYAVDCLDLELARVPRIAVVGSGTEAAARMRGLRVEMVNYDGDAAALWKQLERETASGSEPRKVCHPRSSLASSPPASEGITLLSPVVYETMGIAFDRTVIDRVDAAAVTSASAVRSIGRVDLPLASIGPTTSAAIRELGMEPWVQSLRPTFSSLADAIAEGAEAMRRGGSATRQVGAGGESEP